jgi:leucyl aminopeptidase (aminopeptidase T)
MSIIGSVRRILDVCIGLKAGEHVLVVTDTGFDPAITDTFALAAAERGAEVATIVMTPRSRVGEMPPAMVADAMKHANVVMELCSVWVGSSKARIDACAAGARYLTWPGLDAAVLRKGGPTDADFIALRPFLETLNEKFLHANRIRVMSRGGTDLVASLAGRKGRALKGIATERGIYEAPPHLEVGIGPVEDSAEGVFVVDGRIQHSPFGEVTAPFRVVVRGGRIVEIQGEGGGKPFADYLRTTLAAYNDPNIYVIAELAFGMNPKASRWDRDMESESILGTAHFGMGDNLGYGGVNKAAGHRDCVFRDATLFLDDELIMKDGVIQMEGFPT